MQKLSSAVLFFPGLIFHEVSHYIACKLVGVKVFRVKFFDVKEAFVEHAQPGAWKSIVITLAPFFLGNYFGLELLKMGNVLLQYYNPLGFLFYWFALSLVFYSFPSVHDSRNAFNSFNEFYSRRILKQGNAFSRVFWLITLPFVYIPLILVLGFVLAFNYSAVLRLLWVLLMVAVAFDPVLLNQLIQAVNALIAGIVGVFIG